MNTTEELFEQAEKLFEQAHEMYREDLIDHLDRGGRYDDFLNNEAIDEIAAELDPDLMEIIARHLRSYAFAQGEAIEAEYDGMTERNR